MSEHEHFRQIDKWLKWAAIIGPFIGFLFGIPSGFLLAKDRIDSATVRVGLIENWKIQQDSFNLETVKAITRLKALIKDTQP